MDTIHNSIEAILHSTFNGNHGFSTSYSIMEKEISLSSFHYLFNYSKNEKETSKLIALMTSTLFAPFHNPEMDKIVEYMRTVFFEKFPNEAKRVWCCLIKYAEFKKVHSSSYDYYDEKKLKAIKLKEKKFIAEQSAITNLSLDISTLDFKKNEGEFLTRAFVITPYITNEKVFSDFTLHFISLLTTDLKSEQNDNEGQSQRKLNAQFYIRSLLLYADVSLSKAVLDLILNPIYVTDFNHIKDGNDVFEFSSKIIEYVIYKLDEIIAGSTDKILNKRLIDNFWGIWEYLFEKIKDTGALLLTSTLFLDIQWMKDLTHWKVLETKKEFYHKMVKTLGATKTQSILNLFSTVGEQTFLPEGMSWLVDIYKTDVNTTVSLISPSAERMIERLFYNHISKIKRDKKLIDDYLWILNRMVDLGSSKAYLFRENVITYKTIN